MEIINIQKFSQHNFVALKLVIEITFNLDATWIILAFGFEPGLSFQTVEKKSWRCSQITYQFLENLGT